jgi:arginine/lysine/ornithine decarboxylase
MTQHELDAGLDVMPQGLAVSMGVYDKTLRAAEEIGKEVSKNINGCFMPWQRTQTHPIHFQFHTLRPEAKLETGK